MDGKFIPQPQAKNLNNAKNPSYVNLSKFNIGGISSYIKIYRGMNDCSIKMVSFCTLNLEKWLKIRLFRTSFLIPTRRINPKPKHFCLGFVIPREKI